MKLEEVIERLKDDVKYADLRDIVDDDCTICFIEDIETVLQELEHLQKENEELKNMDLTTVYITGVSDEKDRWRTKIREKIEKEEAVVETCYGRIKYQEGKIAGLQDLLKEE